MPERILYVGPLSLFSRKVEIALREKGLGYERVLVPFTQEVGYQPKHPVVARSNPLRFMKEAPELEDLIKTIRGKVERFNVDKIKQEDIVASGGGAPDED